MEQILQRRLEIGFALLILAALVVFFVIGLSYPARPRELPLLIDGIGIVGDATTSSSSEPEARA